ncbi:IclR family transcriptional regulator [Chloroflexota bacterium]
MEKGFDELKKNDGKSKSVIRAIAILESLSEGFEIGITELSRKIQLTKPTTHRILNSLESNGFVSKSLKTRKYSLGPKIISLASNPWVVHQSLVSAAFNEMNQLREKHNESVCLHIALGINGMCLDSIESSHNIRHAQQKGYFTPLHIGAAGRVLLSQLSLRELDVFFKCTTLIKLGPNTVTDEEKIRVAIEKTKKRGYDVSFSEGSVGGVGIAVPIYGHVCPVAILIIGPENRFDSARIENMVKDLKESAAITSNKLSEIEIGLKSRI